MFEKVTSTSSMIKSFAYDEDAKILAVTFKNNSEWYYHNVPEKIFNDMKESDSHGKFFLANIKGKYRDQPFS